MDGKFDFFHHSTSEINNLSEIDLHRDLSSNPSESHARCTKKISNRSKVLLIGILYRTSEIMRPFRDCARTLKIPLRGRKKKYSLKKKSQKLSLPSARRSGDFPEKPVFRGQLTVDRNEVNLPHN
ncbi:hypothetical protein CDAR_113451 [Caerostris darwini]|uniref:Uncharacterized protein n=1 Tax=Caerostris darwini TaxID=1538125 RepID=A0AAV4QZY3_9ARAC|nr:hypothetical protein CDAR_113451 [Caerostris darwini]